jgi:hypothetical protein
MESKDKEMPYNMATALDCAIRDSEVENDTKKYGYKVKDNVYYNYMSNEYWKSFRKDMPEEHRNQFDNGSGGELKEKKGRWGIYPPKMASFGSSSRMIYELSKDIPGFCFEEQLDTRVGGIANLDGFLKKDNKYIYIEAKRREIYSSTHESEEIKEVYLPVYKWVEDKCGKKYFSFKIADAKEEGIKKVTFYLNNNPVQYFDLKQLICHFLGIAYELAKHSINANVKFLYLIFNPEKVENNIDEKYRKNIITRYKEVKDFIEGNIKVIIQIFYTVLEYQLERQKLPRVEINFEYELVDQNSYKDELK